MVVTHDQRGRRADRVVTLRDGQILLRAPGHEIAKVVTFITEADAARAAALQRTEAQ